MRTLCAWSLCEEEPPEKPTRIGAVVQWRAMGKLGRGCLLCLVVAERMSGRMEKSGFEDTDYSVVVRIRRSRPIAWRWEIYRAGRTYPIGQSPVFFRTMAAANKAGKAALKQLLAKLNT